VVDLHAAFGEQFLDVAIRQRKTQVPAHCKDDHVGREAEASEGRPGDGWTATTGGFSCNSLPALGSLAADATAPRKVANQRRDFHHREARKLVAAYDAIVVEDLKITNMLRRAKPRPDPDAPGSFLSQRSGGEDRAEPKHL